MKPERGAAIARRTAVLFLFSIFFCAFPAGAAYGVDWRHYAEDIEGNFLYYDSDSITESKGIVSVWQKKVFNVGNLFRIRQVLGERYKKLIEKISLFEIHCPTRQVQERAYAYYDGGGELIDARHDERKYDWRKIVSGTDMVLLYGICCKRGESKSGAN